MDNYERFENKFLNYLKNDDKENVDADIEQNQKLIKEYLNEEHNLIFVGEFIIKLNNIIIGKKEFNLIEEVLKHKLFTVVLKNFRESEILLKACKIANKYAVKWLLTMDINPYYQDEEGMTALMESAQHWSLDFAVDYLLKNNEKHIHLTNKKNNNALFYACNNINMFKKLLDAKIDYNHLNNNNDSILTYCCKQDKLKAFDILINKPDINVNVINYDGKTAAMYLAEHARFEELKSLVMKKNIDVNFINKQNENLVVCYIKKYYDYYRSESIKKFLTEYNYLKIKRFSQTLKTLIEIGCDFNCIIDGDGNTPILFYMIIEDFISAYYLLTQYKKINLSIKNKYNMNASYLSLYINEESIDKLSYNNHNAINFRLIREAFLNNETFDFNYFDQYNNNLLIHCIIRNDFFAQKILYTMDKKFINEMNKKNENALIIATKLGNNNILYHLLFYPEKPSIGRPKVKINYKDNLGNTALYYAVKLKDKYAINVLMSCHADPTIKNNERVSPLDLAYELRDKDLLDLLHKPLPLNEFNDSDEDSDTNSIKSISSFSSLFRKKKKTDKKLEKYIKNYRITNYRNDYDYLLNRNFISYYAPSKYVNLVEQWILDILYPEAEVNTGIKKNSNRKYKIKI